jgi:hypothetical protein
MQQRWTSHEMTVVELIHASLKQGCHRFVQLSPFLFYFCTFSL